jgi:TATA-binding protein-associated factor
MTSRSVKEKIKVYIRSFFITIRLDRLLILLDTGSTPLVRSTAAKQLAQLAVKGVISDVSIVEDDLKSAQSRQQVSLVDGAAWSELLSVVARVGIFSSLNLYLLIVSFKIMPYLHSKSFESRTAASVALSQIFTLIPIWLPSCERDASIPMSNLSESLSPPEFPIFSIQELITQGTLLLASSGKEFVKPAGILSSSHEVKKARKAAMDRLGLGFLEGVEDDMDLDKEFAAEMEVDPGCGLEPDTSVSSPMDLCPPEVQVAKAPSPSTRSVTPNLPSPSTPTVPSESDAILSARERNRLKRKRKPGNSAFVAAPPPQTAGARYSAASSGPSNKYVEN